MEKVFEIIPRMTAGNIALASFFPGVENLFYKWLNDVRITTFMGDLDPMPITFENAVAYTKSHQKDTWIICVKEEDVWKPIGYVGLFIRNRHSVGIYRIAIGEAQYLGRGYAKYATAMLLKWSFAECNLQKVHLTVSADNAAGIASYKRVGFQQCGIYKNARFANGVRNDEVSMEVDLESFESSQFFSQNKNLFS
jgi:RimJ/RimL family protein N-acetyltransferase